MRKLPSIEKIKAETEKIKADAERVRREADEIDMERGYCKLPFPAVSDVWAEECYQKHWPEIKVFLADYAELLLTAKEIIALGHSERVQQWIDELQVAAKTKDTHLAIRCFVIANVFLKMAIEGNSTEHYAKYADWIVDILSDYPYSVYYKDRYVGDYDGNYEEYYAKKREVLTKWDAN